MVRRTRKAPAGEVFGTDFPAASFQRRKEAWLRAGLLSGPTNKTAPFRRWAGNGACRDLGILKFTRSIAKAQPCGPGVALALPTLVLHRYFERT